MALSFDFEDDVEFRRLLVRTSNVDLVIVALEVARDAYPELTFDHTLNWIAKRGSELIGPASRCRHERELLKEIARCLAGTHGLHGDRHAYQRPECSYIHRVIETGVGIPLSLSLVYIAVSQVAGINLQGVAAPMHFLTRYDSTHGTFFLDPFHAGRVLSYDRCLSWLVEITQLPHEQIIPMLDPASPREIVVRMLNNLKAIYIRQSQWEAAWKVQRRLCALQPSDYDQRRDMGLIALKANRPAMAIELLQQCLRDSHDREEQRSLARHLQQAESMLSRWN